MCKGISKPGDQYVELETHHEGDLYGVSPLHMSPADAPQEPMLYNFKIEPGRYQVAEIGEDGEVYISLVVQLEAVQDRSGDWMGISKGGENIPVVHIAADDPTLSCNCPSTHAKSCPECRELMVLTPNHEFRYACPSCGREDD